MKPIQYFPTNTFNLKEPEIFNPHKELCKVQMPYKNILCNSKIVKPMLRHLESEIFNQDYKRKIPFINEPFKIPSPYISESSTKSRNSIRFRQTESIEKPLFTNSKSKIDFIAEPTESELEFSISELDFDER